MKALGGVAGTNRPIDQRVLGKSENKVMNLDFVEKERNPAVSI